MSHLLFFLRLLPPEFSHHVSVFLLRLCGFFKMRPFCVKSAPSLKQKWRGLTFNNPVGIAAGFDKNGRIFDVLLSCGVGHVEIGTVTLAPRKGNPKPRVWRFPKQHAIVNHLGFNNMGADKLADRLSQGITIPQNHHLGISISAMPNAKNMVEDMRQTYHMLAPYASYVTLNMASPNTKGLRTFQSKGIKGICEVLADTRENNPSLKDKPLLLKLSPDESQVSFVKLCKVALTCGFDGLVVSNTSQNLRRKYTKITKGGLSGKPLFRHSTTFLKHAYLIAQTYKHKPIIIASGGISDGNDAYEKILHGASLLQLYTALIYQGPALLSKITDTLTTLLKRDGYASLQEAVGGLCTPESLDDTPAS